MWRKTEKRCAQIEKPGVLFACSAFPGYSQLYHSCHLLISYGENRDVDFDTFFETAHHFLFSTRLLPLTREEKLSQMCQEKPILRGQCEPIESPSRCIVTYRRERRGTLLAEGEDAVAATSMVTLRVSGCHLLSRSSRGPSESPG
jgi:hypothetical protein